MRIAAVNTNTRTSQQPAVSFEGKYKQICKIRKELDSMGVSWDYSMGLKKLTKLLNAEEAEMDRRFGTYGSIALNMSAAYVRLFGASTGIPVGKVSRGMENLANKVNKPLW